MESFENKRRLSKQIKTYHTNLIDNNFENDQCDKSIIVARVPRHYRHEITDLYMLIEGLDLDRLELSTAKMKI